MKIRPHHLLCMGNFVGKGYSEEFTANMRRVITSLENGESLILVNCADDICRACPFNTSGICKDEEKVMRYDTAAKSALSLEYGREYVYNEISEAVTEKIYKAGKLSDICGDCEWFELCNSVILKKVEKNLVF